MMVLWVIGVAVLCQMVAGEDADFAEYKKEHPMEFGPYVEGDMIVDDSFRNGIINRRQLWPGGVVYYDIDRNAGFSGQEHNNIQAAIADFRRYTCIRWERRTNQGSFVRLFRGGGCFSLIGMNSYNGRPQMLSLGRGCTGKGTIIHEMLHAIGFVHEQSRTDRDQYLNIYWQNIQSNMRDQFKKHGSDYISLLNTRYDYGSVMHYGPRAFSANGQATMAPKQAGAQIGQNRGFSQLDIERVNRLYCNRG